MFYKAMPLPISRVATNPGLLTPNLYLRGGEKLDRSVSDDMAGHEMTRVNLLKCGFLFLAYTLFTSASWIEPTP